MKRLLVVAVYTVLAVAVAGLGAYLAVSLVVERTPEVSVPDLVGKGLSDALDELQGTGLDLEIRRFTYSDAVPENHIVRQRPEPGARVKAGRSVGVTLSRGPERHPVPDVRGLSLEDARILFEEAGLRLRVGPRLPWGPAGQVAAQAAPPGIRLPRGSEVAVVASTGPRPVLLRMPRIEGLSLDDALAELARYALRTDRVEEQKPVTPAQRGRVVAQSPLPGFPVAEGGAVSLTVAGRARWSGRTRAVVVGTTAPVGFARHRVEVIWDRTGGGVVLFDDWIPGGTRVDRWIPLGPGERATVRLDGRVVSEAGP